MSGTHTWGWEYHTFISALIHGTKCAILISGTHTWGYKSAMSGTGWDYHTLISGGTESAIATHVILGDESAIFISVLNIKS